MLSAADIPRQANLLELFAGNDGQMLAPGNAAPIPTALFFRNQDFLELSCQISIYLIEFTDDVFNFGAG